MSQKGALQGARPLAPRATGPIRIVCAMLYPFDCNTVYLSNRRDGGGTQAKGPRGGVLAGGAPGAVPSRFRPGLLFFLHVLDVVSGECYTPTPFWVGDYCANLFENL